MTDQKSFATQLDTAASRAEVVDQDGASRKQCWFLAKLMLDANETPDDYGFGHVHTSAVLTRREASSMIGDHLK